jgi:hypothetical protein
MTRLIRAALLVAAGIWVALPSTAQAQDESRDDGEKSVVLDNGSGMIVPSKDVEPGTLITSRELEEFLGKTITVRHKASEEYSTRYVLRTLLVSSSGRTIGQCTSGAAALQEGVPMTFPDVCKDGSLTRGLDEFGVETLTIENTEWVDGKPVNMGLWAPKNLDKSSLGLSIVVAPEKDDGEGARLRSGTLLITLKYPIEHG